MEKRKEKVKEARKDGSKEKEGERKDEEREMDRKQKKDLEKDKMERKTHCRSKETGPSREVHGLSCIKCRIHELAWETGFLIFTNL